MNKRLKTMTVKMLKRFEGYSEKPYLCPAKKWTIGYGHNFEDNGFTTKELVAILNANNKQDLMNVFSSMLVNRINWIDTELTLKFPFYQSLPVEVKSVFIQMAYQMGLDGFYKFKKTIGYAEKRDWKSVSTEMLNSKWAKQTKNRAKELSEIISGLQKK